MHPRKSGPGGRRPRLRHLRYHDGLRRGVDAVERLAIAGPQADRNYRQIYGFDPDYLRRSSLDRQVFDSRLDLSRRLGFKHGETDTPFVLPASITLFDG